MSVKAMVVVWMLLSTGAKWSYYSEPMPLEECQAEVAAWEAFQGAVEEIEIMNAQCEIVE